MNLCLYYGVYFRTYFFTSKSTCLLKILQFSDGAYFGTNGVYLATKESTGVLMILRCY